MPTPKIAVALEKSTLKRLDRVGDSGVFRSRSQAIEQAVAEKLARMEHGRLARECAKLDRRFEKALAEEGLSEEASAWPEYRGAKSAGATSPQRAAASRTAGLNAGPT